CRFVKLQRPPPEMRIFLPMRSACSSTATRRPRLPASMAHISPAAPPPRTMTSKSRRIDNSFRFQLSSCKFGRKRFALHHGSLRTERGKNQRGIVGELIFGMRAHLLENRLILLSQLKRTGAQQGRKQSIAAKLDRIAIGSLADPIGIERKPVAAIQSDLVY